MFVYKLNSGERERENSEKDFSDMQFFAIHKVELASSCRFFHVMLTFVVGPKLSFATSENQSS